MKTIHTDSAYPFIEDNGNANGYVAAHGLTKRELFAAMAMQGMMLLYTDNRFSPQDIAEWSVIQANLLIAEPNKEVQS